MSRRLGDAAELRRRATLNLAMPQPSSPPRIVVTGGPGAGKTTLLDALSNLGHTIVSDTARSIIRARLSRGETRRPEPSQFAREILEIDIAKYQSTTSESGAILFERGIVDALGMLNHLGALESAELTHYLTTYPYCPRVFVLPPWQAIYRTDSERDQTFADSIAVHHSVCQWYIRCGYELVEVPRLPVEQRCEYVSKAILSSV